MLPLLGFGQEEETFQDTNPLAELHALGYKEITINSLFDKKVIAVLKKALKQSNLKTLPREDVKKIVGESLKGNPLGKVFQKFPQGLEVFVDVIRDEHALPGLLDIFAERKKLQYFGYGWMIMFFLSLWFKGSIIDKYKPFYVRIPQSILYSLTFTGIVMTAYYFLFKDQLDPTIQVVRGTLRI